MKSSTADATSFLPCVGSEAPLGGNTYAAVVGSLGNMGPAFGEAGPTATFQAAFSTPARLILAVLMLAGRLELFAVLLMFSTPTRFVQTAAPRRRVR